MVDYFVAEESNLFIFNQPICCHICAHNIFIPYDIYSNVEKPGIQVIYTHYAAICQQCGFVMEFSDPSTFNDETGEYMWALNQQLIQEQEEDEETVPTLSDEVIAAQKRCIYLALQRLTQHKVASNNVYALYNGESFLSIAQLFRTSYEPVHKELITRDCLVILLNTLMEKGIVLADALIPVLEHEGYKELEAFLANK